jgi:hypothetical protein
MLAEPDHDEPQPMGDEDKEVSEEDMDKANEKKREAITAFSEQEFGKAVELYTEAILLNPGKQIFLNKSLLLYLSVSMNF